MTTPEFPSAEPQGVPSRLASWGTRAAGLIIDFAPVWILGIIFSRSDNVFGIGGLIGLINLAYFIYMGYLDGISGQTPGKALMGTRVVNTQGELIGSGAGIGRKFAHIVDSLVCGLGWLLPLVDSKRQTIADKLLTTYVVEGVEKRPFSIDLWMPPKS